MRYRTFGIGGLEDALPVIEGHLQQGETFIILAPVSKGVRALSERCVLSAIKAALEAIARHLKAWPITLRKTIISFPPSMPSTAMAILQPWSRTKDSWKSTSLSFLTNKPLTDLGSYL